MEDSKLTLRETAGRGTLTAAVLASGMALLLLAFSAWSGALAGKIGPRPQLIAGPLRSAGGDYLTTVLPGVTVFGIGLTLLVAPLTATVIGLSGTEYAEPAPLTAAFQAATLWCAGGLTAGAMIPLLVRP